MKVKNVQAVETLIVLEQWHCSAQKKTEEESIAASLSLSEDIR